MKSSKSWQGVGNERYYRLITSKDNGIWVVYVA